MRRPNRRPNYMEPGDINNWENNCSYTIYKTGSLVKARDERTGKIISSNQYLDVPFNAAALLLLNGGTIYIKCPPTGIYNTYNEMEIPATCNGGVNVIGEGFNWYNYGVVIKPVRDVGVNILNNLDVGVNMAVFRNLSFHGNQAAGAYNLVGLYAQGQDMHIENCSFYDCNKGIKLGAQAVVFTAGGTVQQTFIIDPPEHGHLCIKVLNGSQNDTITNVIGWYSIQSWPPWLGDSRGLIDTAEVYD